MEDSSGGGKKLGVTAFKPNCLAHIGDVASGRTPRIVLTRHGRPVAAVVPIANEGPGEAWGALRGRAWIAEDFNPDA